MILLESFNRIIQEVLESHIKGGNTANVDITIADFDGVTFHIHTSPKSNTILIISMAMKGSDDCKKNGGDEILKELYGDLLVETEANYDVTLHIDCASVDEPDKLINNVSKLKQKLLGAPLQLVLKDVAVGKKGDILQIKYREDESFFLVPQGNQLTLAYNIMFKDADDVVIAKVFLQEFKDARRRFQAAPAVSYSKEVPLELQDLKLQELDNQGYICFVLFPRHFGDISKREETVELLQTFRNYLHYHIKCSKAYMHMRMRRRVEMLLKVLNRARPEEKKEKKTASGRTFARQ